MTTRLDDNPKRRCSCPETKFLRDGQQFQFVPDLHNCDYSRKRAELVPQAEDYADKIAGDKRENAGRWMKAFCAEMERLAVGL